MAEAAPGLEVDLRQRGPIPLDVHIECAPGEVLALLGPSGSGKTTILRAISGLVQPQEGYIACGDDVWLQTARGINRRPQQRRIGYVFQHFALFPHMTAAQNVMTALEHRPRTARLPRALDLLARVHLEGLSDRRPGQLSGGQQQRVAMARALARDPAVLLLDEPFSSVDRATREKLYRELAALRRDLAMPTVLVTHDLAEAAMLADRMAVLHRGRILQTGSVNEVLNRPRDVTVARLIDIRNVFSGRIAAQEPGRTLIDWQGVTLEAGANPDLAVGSPCNWCIRASQILLHRRDRPSHGEAENRATGRIAEMVTLGDSVSIDMQMDNGALLQFPLSAHVASRNGLAPGAATAVSLRAEAIHIMPS